MITVKDIVEYLDSIAPFNTQSDWDNSGLLTGDASAQVEKVGFCLDLTPQTLGEAIKAGVQLIVTHHPIIFRAQKSFLSGNIAYEAARAGISVVCTHTCYDAAEGGVNDVLCEALGIYDVMPLYDVKCDFPLLRIGNISETDGVSLAKLVAKKLDTVVRLSDVGRPIKRVAICGGAGGDFAPAAKKAGADAFITGEAKHNEIFESAADGITMIVAGHFETENPAVLPLMKRVGENFHELETVILKQDNPVKYIG